MTPELATALAGYITVIAMDEVGQHLYRGDALEGMPSATDWRMTGPASAVIDLDGGATARITVTVEPAP